MRGGFPTNGHSTLRCKNWIVYAKPPFGLPEHVLAYLGRYTHRVATATSRPISATEASVTYRWRDDRHGNAPRLMSLHQHEFNRCFLIHSLPLFGPGISNRNV